MSEPKLTMTYTLGVNENNFRVDINSGFAAALGAPDDDTLDELVAQLADHVMPVLAEYRDLLREITREFPSEPVECGFTLTQEL
jgi:hypothetical protein